MRKLGARVSGTILMPKRVSFGGVFGRLLGCLWETLGPLWGYLGTLGLPLGSLWDAWDPFGLTLELLWSHFGCLELPLGSFWTA